MINQSKIDEEMKKLMYFRIVLTYISLFIIIIGIIGNAGTFIIFYRSKKRLSTRVFLASLSIAAILALSGLLINHTFYGIFIYYEYFIGINIIMIFYPYVYPFIVTFQMSAIWLTVAASVNQFKIVSRGIIQSNKTKQNFRAELLSVLFIFVFSGIYCIPYWLKFTYTTTSGIEITTLGKSQRFNRIVHFWLYLPMAYFIPFSVLLFTNCYLIATLKKKSLLNNVFETAKEPNTMERLNLVSKIKHKSTISKLKPASNCSLVALNNENKIKDSTFMLIAVVIFFFICQLPSLILHIIESFNSQRFKTNIYYFYCMEFAKFLLIVNLAFNFAIFFLFSKHFRKFIKF